MYSRRVFARRSDRGQAAWEERQKLCVQHTDELARAKAERNELAEAAKAAAEAAMQSEQQA
eukprot:1439753-Pyramimonas_sp.AAC.1